MKHICLVLLTLLALGLASCATTPPPPVCAARLFTVDNKNIVVRNLKLWEKNYQVESEQFHPRWRQSLKKINLEFDEVASALKIDKDTTRVNFRDGREDDFSEFFMDEYNFRGWSEYGPFEISATLVRGLVFLDENGRPVPGAETDIPPVVYLPEALDRFVTFDGDIISGNLLADQFKIRTPYGALFVDRGLISEIVIDREKEDLMEIINLKNGDIISGWIEPAQFQMEISDGQVVTMEVDNLSRILFARPVAFEED